MNPFDNFVFQSALSMNDLREHLKDISEIRSLMENQTKFLSLSGLSGVVAGICALLGAAAAWLYLGGNIGIVYEGNRFVDLNVLVFLMLDGAITLVTALSFAIFFSWRMARKRNLPFMNDSAFRLLVNIAIPLVAGGILGLIQIYHGIGQWAPSTMLLFYGMALLNGSKYTLPEIRVVGLAEIVLGLFAAFFWQYGILIWALGFGVLHIVYGAVMYFKYER